MDIQTIHLGLILKEFPEFEFSTDTFKGRLRLQKFIYLLQAFNVYLGYNYSWYIYGPYCTTLATCGFALNDIYNKIPAEKVKFAQKSTQDRLESFKEFIAGRENDNNFLEIAASLHYLRNTTSDSDEDVILKVVNKRKKFKQEDVKPIWKKLKEWGLL